MSLPLSAPPSAAAWLAQFNGYQRAYAHPSAPAEQLEQIRAAGLPVQLDPIAPRDELVLLKDPLPLTASRLGKRAPSEGRLRAIVRELTAPGPGEEPRLQLRLPRGPSLLFDAQGSPIELAPMPLKEDFEMTLRRTFSQPSNPANPGFYGVDRKLSSPRLKGAHVQVVVAGKPELWSVHTLDDIELSAAELRAMARTRAQEWAARPKIFGAGVFDSFDLPTFLQPLPRDALEREIASLRLMFTRSLGHHLHGEQDRYSGRLGAVPADPVALAEASDPATPPARLVDMIINSHREVKHRAMANPSLPGHTLRTVLTGASPWAWLNPTASLEALLIPVSALEQALLKLLREMLRWWPRSGLLPGDPELLGLRALVRRARWSMARAEVVINDLTPAQGRQVVETVAGVLGMA